MSEKWSNKVSATRADYFLGAQDRHTPRPCFSAWRAPFAIQFNSLDSNPFFFVLFEGAEVI